MEVACAPTIIVLLETVVLVTTNRRLSLPASPTVSVLATDHCAPFPPRGTVFVSEVAA
mgnify:CR=1 FL=1